MASWQYLEPAIDTKYLLDLAENDWIRRLSIDRLFFCFSVLRSEILDLKSVYSENINVLHKCGISQQYRSTVLVWLSEDWKIQNQQNTMAQLNTFLKQKAKSSLISKSDARHQTMA